MNISTYFLEKLSRVLFLDIKSTFNKIDLNGVPLPIQSSNIIKDIENGRKMNDIPIGYFIEGMFFVLGADKHFKYNESYIKILKNLPASTQHIKGVILNNVKAEQYEDAYLMLKGLVSVEENTENYEKLLLLCDRLRITNSIFEGEELQIIKEAKQYRGFPTPYIYEAYILKDKMNYENALASLREFINMGGTETEDIREFGRLLAIDSAYEVGKKSVIDDPEKALRLLLPLTEKLEENPNLYYYIAVAYRRIENYEKAIYYLNDALSLDSAIVEVVNELGLNYAFIGDYNKAISCFRKAFDATKSVEVCTNLIMCYYNIGDFEQAINHLNIAKKLAPEDEIVMKFDNLLKKEK